MLLSMLAVILSFAVIFFISGFVFKVYPLFLVAGIAFLITALLVFSSGISVQTGSFEVETLPCNVTCADGDLYNVTTNTTNTYTSSLDGSPVTNAILGMFMVAMAFFSFGGAVIYATPKKDQEYQAGQD